MKHADDRLDDIAELFEQSDEDRDGLISLTEYRGLMLTLDRRRRDEEVTRSFLKIDSDHDGRIGLEEFRAWWLRN